MEEMSAGVCSAFGMLEVPSSVESLSSWTPSISKCSPSELSSRNGGDRHVLTLSGGVIKVWSSRDITIVFVVGAPDGTKATDT